MKKEKIVISKRQLDIINKEGYYMIGKRIINNEEKYSYISFDPYYNIFYISLNSNIYSRSDIKNMIAEIEKKYRIINKLNTINYK